MSFSTRLQRQNSRLLGALDTDILDHILGVSEPCGVRDDDWKASNVNREGQDVSRSTRDRGDDGSVSLSYQRVMINIAWQQHNSDIRT